MTLERRLQALEAAHKGAYGLGLFVRTMDALRREDAVELAALEVELAGATDKPGEGYFISIARSLLVGGR